MPSTPSQPDQTPTTPMTIRGLQDLIRERYFKTDSARGTAGTFLYLAEEFGELATALAANNSPKRPPTPEERANLEEEFADVLAWLATLANINSVDLEACLAKYTTPGLVEGVKD
jgi:NTP pyrophosphatase (non-canonical NTP hydrolase)